jgi:hypothetical protein
MNELKLQIAAQALNGFIIGHGMAYKSMNFGDDTLFGYINLSKFVADSLYHEMREDTPKIKFDTPRSQGLDDNGNIT